MISYLPEEVDRMVTSAVQKAVAVMRERCAKIADEEAALDTGHAYWFPNHRLKFVAAKIREML